jgi:hypothetical protein
MRNGAAEKEYFLFTASSLSSQEVPGASRLSFFRSPFFVFRFLFLLLI